MAGDNTHKNGWSEEAKYVLRSLDELKKQYKDAEDKIELNREAFINAVNSLELTLSKEMLELKTEIKIMKTRYAARAVMWSSIIPALTAAVLLILKFI
jgi:hypothetical protein